MMSEKLMEQILFSFIGYYKNSSSYASEMGSCWEAVSQELTSVITGSPGLLRTDLQDKHKGTRTKTGNRIRRSLE